jgi:hypothetical protein
MKDLTIAVTGINSVDNPGSGTGVARSLREAKLFYSIDRDCFMCHRLEGEDRDLALLAIALPKLPLVHQTGQMWTDYLPIGLFVTGFRRGLYLFASSFFPQLASAHYLGQWHSESTLVGTISIPGIVHNLHTAISFDLDHQIIQINVGDRVLVRQFWANADLHPDAKHSEFSNAETATGSCHLAIAVTKPIDLRSGRIIYSGD